MIGVTVYKQEDGGYFVVWNDVIGFLCVIETPYHKELLVDGRPKKGVTHKEMTDWGWTPAGETQYVVHPVTLDGEYEVLVWDGTLDKTSDQVARTLVACHWPPEQDREQAIRVGCELLAGTGERNCADLPNP